MVLQGVEATFVAMFACEVRQVGLRAVMPQEQVELCLWVSDEADDPKGSRIRKVWREWTTQVQVGMPVPELMFCSCSLRSRVAHRKEEGRRRV